MTLDDAGRAATTGIPHDDGACSGGGARAGEVSGEGTWSWDGFGRIVVVVDGREVAVQSAFYRGEPDWERLLVDRCGTDFEDDAPLGLFLDGPLSAIGE